MVSIEVVQTMSVCRSDKACFVIYDEVKVNFVALNSAYSKANLF